MSVETYPSKVVGVTFRDQAPAVAGDRLSLSWEIDNPHGPRFAGGKAQADAVGRPVAQAVAVHTAAGQHIGYLRSTESTAAAKVCHHMASLGRWGGTCEPWAWAIVTEITGGTPDKPTRGINIIVHLAYPAAVEPQELI